MLRSHRSVLLALFFLLPLSLFGETSALRRTGDRKALITPEAEAYLDGRAGDSAIVWVFFTDKEAESKDEFSRKASAVTFTGRAMNRRAKMEKTSIGLEDLPVNQAYVDAVIAAGGTLRRTSRWLNAATFRMAKERLDALGSLTFIQRVSPVAQFRKNYPNEDLQRIVPERYPGMAQSPDALNYGTSFTQLNQIKVPAVHDQGYDGTGVTLAIFDTGFRKTHEAFAKHYLDGRVLGEYDFINNDTNTANEAGDASTQWNHGTLIWGTSGGEKDGTLYGPAYRANFLLAKTEDVTSETPVEEDNWVAALEWADSAGADVITSSLGYSDWYTYADMNGLTAPITLAANTAASLGIVVCNSMGNSGPGAGTLSAPADAFDMLACGAVNSTGTIANFSSRGPTFDGRRKPEVCAMGVGTWASSASGDGNYTTANGTSLSTPLVAGAAVLLIQANPSFTPANVRQALMETASRAATPDNTYGNGIIDLSAALGWGVDFTSDIDEGSVPLFVQFTAETSLSPLTYLWDFGDGNNSTLTSPTHTYTTPGEYTVALTLTTVNDTLTRSLAGFVVAHADTVEFGVDSAYAGQTVIISVRMRNALSLERINIPFTFNTTPQLRLDSTALGSRTTYFERMMFNWIDIANRRYSVELLADNGGGAPPLLPGNGEVLKLYFTLDSLTAGGQATPLDTAIGAQRLTATGLLASFTPHSLPGQISSRFAIRGDANASGNISVADLTFLVNYQFNDGAAPITIRHGDANSTNSVTVADITYLVNYLFNGGPAPLP